MADYSKIAFSEIRDYLWDNLKSTGVLDENDYWIDKMGIKLNPIIPSQQVPEFQNLIPGVPYITYDIETTDYGNEFWITDEIATITVVGDSYSKVYEIMELIKDLFRRYDFSAHDVNDSRSDGTFNFLKFYISGMMSPNVGSEGDGITGTVEVTYCYTRGIESGYRFA